MRIHRIYVATYRDGTVKRRRSLLGYNHSWRAIGHGRLLGTRMEQWGFTALQEEAERALKDRIAHWNITSTEIVRQSRSSRARRMDRSSPYPR